MKKQLMSIILSVAMFLSVLGVTGTTSYAAAGPTPVPMNTVEARTGTGAFLRDFEVTQNDPWKLTVKAKSVTNNGAAYIVLLPYNAYTALRFNTNTLSTLGDSNYNNLTTVQGWQNAFTAYYKYNSIQATSGTEVVLFQDLDMNHAIQTTVNETATTYHMQYVLLIFDGVTSKSTWEDYTKIDFYVNRDGYLQYPSYMVRYHANNFSSGGKQGVTDLPTNTIVGWGADGPVTAETPSRTGYTFLGWDPKWDKLPSSATAWYTNADNKAENEATANAAAASTNTAEYPGGTTGSVPWGTVSAAIGTTFSKTEDKFYELFAIWKPNKVQFNDMNGTTALATKEVTLADGTTKMTLPVVELPAPQVGVSYAGCSSIALKSPTTDSGTSKSYAFVAGAKVKLDETKTYTTANITASTSFSLTPAQNTNTTWKITGTPQHHSETEVYALLKVQDDTNKTSDYVLVRFPEVKKRAQDAPDRDVNTGLQGDVTTLDGTEGKKLPQAVEDAKLAELNAEGGTHTAADLYEFKDGKLIGFYSPGQQDIKNTSNGETMNDKTGSLRDYYLKNGMIYEYRPHSDSAEPDEGWREIPYPEKYYSGANKTTVANAMGYKATATAYTETKTGQTNVSTAGITGVKASTREDPWPAEYGWISWDDGVPVVHGLTEGDVYDVRFRSNTAASASKPIQVTVTAGAASSGGGSSAGLLFNLMRGSVWQIPKPQEQEPQAVTTISVTMGEGGTATITNVKETEATADEGEEPGTEPTSVTITEAGTKTLTVLGQPVTVTVTPTDETHTVTVTADEAPLTPAEGVYTLPEKTVTGALALNISLTAPETPPDTPAARAAVTTETDVTDTLFAASPTGTLPDGSALGLGEGETLQLRDPEGEPVDSITFYVSATGSVENTDGGAGLFDTYICALNETKTALVWSKVVNEVSTSVTSVDLGGTFKSLAAQFGGAPDPSAFAAVVFYDWDGKQIGSTVAPKGDASATITAFEQLPNVDALLKSHAGYDFLAWVKNEDEIPSSYGWRTVSAGKGSTVELPLNEEDKADFSNLTESIIVKAAYTTNDSIELGKTQVGSAAQIAARNYQTSIVAYNRFGTSQVFSITIEVRRGNVPRVTNGYLWVRSQISGVDSYSRYPLTGADVETVEVALYAQTASSGAVTGVSLVEWTVIDDYGYSNWVGAGTSGERTNRPDCQATASFEIKDVGTQRNQQVWNKGSYPNEAILGSIYQQLVERDTSGTALAVNAAQLRTIGVAPFSTNNTTLRNGIYTNWINAGKPDFRAGKPDQTPGQTWDILNQIASVAPTT